MIVTEDIYKHYKYIITHNTIGPLSWYCAYVEIPKRHPFYECSYDDVNLCVHGGVTFANFLNTGNRDEFFCIGWDYNHAGDYCCDSYGAHGHKWSVDEIQQECKDAIRQLIQLEHKLIKVYDE